MKTGKKEHIDALLYEGVLYMNTIEYYRDLEAENCQVGDKYEGIAKLHQATQILLGDTNGKWTPLTNDGKTIPIRESNSSLNQGNVYCMYGVFKDSFVEKDGNFFHCPTINNKMFGDTRLFINNPKEFINRCEKAAKKQNITISPSRVNYYDEKTYSGEISPFDKRMCYSSQSEFRLYYPNFNHQPYTLTIGPIDDIACCFSYDDMFCAKNNGNGTISRYIGKIEKK